MPTEKTACEKVQNIKKARKLVDRHGNCRGANKRNTEVHAFVSAKDFHPVNAPIMTAFNFNEYVCVLLLLF